MPLFRLKIWATFCVVTLYKWLAQALTFWWRFTIYNNLKNLCMIDQVLTPTLSLLTLVYNYVIKSYKCVDIFFNFQLLNTEIGNWTSAKIQYVSMSHGVIVWSQEISRVNRRQGPGQVGLHELPTMNSVFHYIMDIKLYFWVPFEIIVGSSYKPTCTDPWANWGETTRPRHRGYQKNKTSDFSLLLSLTVVPQAR